MARFTRRVAPNPDFDFDLAADAAWSRGRGDRVADMDALDLGRTRHVDQGTFCLSHRPLGRRWRQHRRTRRATSSLQVTFGNIVSPLWVEQILVAVNPFGGLM